MPKAVKPEQVAFLRVEKQLANSKLEALARMEEGAGIANPEFYNESREALCKAVEHLFKTLPDLKLVEEQAQAGTRSQVDYSYYRHFLPLFPETYKEVQAVIEEKDKNIANLQEEKLNQQLSVDVDAIQAEIKSFYFSQLEEAQSQINQLKAEKEQLAQQLNAVIRSDRETEFLESDLEGNDCTKEEIQIQTVVSDMELPTSKYISPTSNDEQQEIVAQVEQVKTTYLDKKDTQIVKTLDHAVDGKGELKEGSPTESFRTAATTYN